MGGLLPARPDGAAGPTFAVSALRDPGTGQEPGTSLERIQIVKGWVKDGATQERVYDIATAADATLDLATCATTGGDDVLCSVWTDPDFDPDARAFYYARILEIPTCRWQTWICNEAGVRCNDLATLPAGFEACCNVTVPKTIRERAVTSPIWYAPAKPPV
jgi:hypothetical protein